MKIAGVFSGPATTRRSYESCPVEQHPSDVDATRIILGEKSIDQASQD
jgi:hypothetical protein